MYKIILFFLISTPVLASTLKNVTIVLPWKHQFQFAGYYVAKELGLYKKLGLNVIITEYDLKRFNASDVAQQKYEFGVGHAEIILEKTNNYDNLMLLGAIHQSSPLILLSTDAQNIKTIEDIKNKKIMMSNNQVNNASINAMLYSQDLKADDFEIIDTSFTPLNLINSKANMMVAFSSNEPYYLSTKDVKYTIFDPKDYGYDFYSDILYTSKEMIKSNPKLVKDFYTASIQGWLHAYENIDEAVELILQKYNTQNKTKNALLYEAKLLKKLAFVDGKKFGDINPLRIKEILTTYRLLKLVKSDTTADFHHYIYDTNIENKIFYTNKDEEKKEQLIEIFQHYKTYIFASIFIIISIILISLYFRNKVKSLLSKKMKELDKNYDIFDKNISAVRTDLSGRITYVTQAFCDTSGYSEKELLGKNPRIFKTDESLDDASYKNLWLTIASGHTWRGEFHNSKKDGTGYWSEAVIYPMLDDKENIVGYEGIRKDITLKKVLLEFNQKLELEVKARTHELNILAITDKLTSLYNRGHIDTELTKYINKYKRYDLVFSIILLDIDYFKKINDTYGHLVGDEVLIKLSKIMSKSVRNTDIVGRWGGEEFMIICPNTNEDGVYQLALNISKDISQHNFDVVGEITVSCGIAQISPSLDEIALINKADKALYKAKELGRNRIER